MHPKADTPAKANNLDQKDQKQHAGMANSEFTKTKHGKNFNRPSYELIR